MKRTVLFETLVEPALDRLAGLGFDLAMRLTRRRYWPLLRDAAADPGRAQDAVLRRIIRENSDTTFGHDHHFEAIADADDFRRHVTVQDYESLRTYIEDQELTGVAALTAAAPVLYAQTSGTSGSPKYLPITAAGIDRVARAQRLFASSVHRGTPMFAGKIVGIGSPAVEGTLPGGSPYGSASGMVYEGMPALVRRKYVLGPEVLAITDHDLRYLVIAALCLAERDVTGVATANPSTLLRLRSVMVASFEELTAAVEIGRLPALDELPSPQRTVIASALVADPDRADELRRLRREHGDEIGFGHVWPRLAAITTWTGGSSGFALGALRPYLDPATRIVELGYSASEVRGSIGIDPETNLCVPLLSDNWFEFVDRARRENDPDTLEPDDFQDLASITEGHEYYVYVTTFDGLYRYDMNDIVTVTGRFGATPTIAFVQKGRGVTNITGEKVTESQVLSAVAQAVDDLEIPVPFFVVLASERDSQYRLYVEQPVSAPSIDASAWSKRVESSLVKSNVEYASKRASGRLGVLSAFTLEPGTGERYRADRVASGQRDAQFKYLHLQYQDSCPFPFDEHVLRSEE